MSLPEFDEVKRRLLAQIESMDETELRIVAESKQSLAYYIYNAFHGIAQLLGYAITLPIAWAVTAAESLYDGLASGIKAGWRQGRRHP